MFADDVILFGEASVEQARIVNTCLQEFCAASGQKVSSQKSNIFFSPNTNDAVMAGVCNILAIPQTEDPGIIWESQQLVDGSRRPLIKASLEKWTNN